MNEEQKDRGTANECVHELKPFREEDWVLEQFIRYREVISHCSEVTCYSDLALRLVGIAAQLRCGHTIHF